MKLLKKITGTGIVILVFISASGIFADTVHTVKKGETLYSISKAYNVSIEAITRANNIRDPGIIRPGMAVRIPGSYTSYTVEKGDTLFGIAKKAGTTVDKIAELNSFEKERKLKIGESILIPSNQELKINEKQDKAPVLVKQEGSGEAKKPEQVADLSWPHPGPRSPIAGTLKGTQIEGKAGDEVRAVTSGKVVWVAPYRGYGKMVMVDYNGSIYGYAGNGETLVNVGEKVEKGDIIGRIGGIEASGKGKVYFFVFKDGKPVELAKN